MGELGELGELGEQDEGEGEQDENEDEQDEVTTQPEWTLTIQPSAHPSLIPSFFHSSLLS